MKKGILLLLLCMGINGYSKSGVRGGGHVIEVGGKLEILDVVTQATCSWMSGKEIIEKIPHVDSILNKVEKLDWYLGFELRREIEYISWCMTGRLYHIESIDSDDIFVIQENDLHKSTQQIAFRLNEDAYIDQSLFFSKRTEDRTRAYIVFHEMLHSYLDMNESMRKFYLHSLVSTIRKVDLGQITTREQLNLNMKKNKMLFTFNTDVLDPLKENVLYALSGDLGKRNILDTTSNLNNVFLNREQIKLLALHDQKIALESTSKTKDQINSYLQNCSQDSFQKMIEGNSNIIGIYEIILDNYKDLPSEKQSIFIKSQLIIEAYQKIQRAFASFDIVFKHQSAFANNELKHFFGYTDKNIKVMELNLKSSLNNEFKIIILLEKFFKTYNISPPYQLEKIISFDRLIDKVKNGQFKHEKEREVASNSLSLLEEDIKNKMQVYTQEDRSL